MLQLYGKVVPLQEASQFLTLINAAGRNLGAWAKAAALFNASLVNVLSGAEDSRSL